MITGGASGIGLALAKRCKSSDMNVIICDINQPTLSSAKEVLAKAEGKGRVEALQVDVSKPSDYETVKEVVEKDFDGKLCSLPSSIDEF